MRQVMMMERNDIEMLRKGEPLIITLPGGQTLEFRSEKKLSFTSAKGGSIEHGSLSDEVLKILAANNSPMRRGEILERMPWANPDSIATTLQNLRVKHKIKTTKIPALGKLTYKYSLNGAHNGK